MGNSEENEMRKKQRHGAPVLSDGLPNCKGRVWHDAFHHPCCWARHFSLPSSLQTSLKPLASRLPTLPASALPSRRKSRILAMGAVGKYTKGWIWWLIVLIIAGLVVTAAVITIRRKSGGSKGSAEPVPGPPGAITKKYADALKIALQFFDVQKSGKLANNEISWRGDSALDDGQEAGWMMEIVGKRKPAGKIESM